MTELVCTVSGVGVTLGESFRVLADWEILLGDEYRRINKQSGRVSGWKTPPHFTLKECPHA